MKPAQLVECLKLTYDFEYARHVSKKMVDAAYPNASEDEQSQLRVMTIAGFQLGNQPDGVKDWTLVDIEEFLVLYAEEIQKKGDTLTHYLFVDDLFKRIAQRTSQLTSAIPETLPYWFKAMYVKPAMAAAA